jgi:hypothetical protein
MFLFAVGNITLANKSKKVGRALNRVRGSFEPRHLSSLDTYDPTFDTFAASTPSMNEPRDNATAALFQIAVLAAKLSRPTAHQRVALLAAAS